MGYVSYVKVSIQVSNFIANLQIVLCRNLAWNISSYFYLHNFLIENETYFNVIFCLLKIITRDYLLKLFNLFKEKIRTNKLSLVLCTSKIIPLIHQLSETSISRDHLTKALSSEMCPKSIIKLPLNFQCSHMFCILQVNMLRLNNTSN